MTGPKIASDVDALVREFVRQGDHVHLAATPSRPNALTNALCRVWGRAGQFTVSTTAVHSSAHALALSGCAKKVIAGFAGDTYPSPRPNPLYRKLAEGEPFEFEAWSLLSYTQRLMAGAMGVPYAVTSSLGGTDLAEGKEGLLRTVSDPDDPGGDVTLIRALRPDITFVHGVCADEHGNVVVVPPVGEGAWSAYAAERGVIASVERIVSAEELAGIPDRVLIPGQRVLGICEAELGAHPQSLRTAGVAGVRGYLDDYEFLEEIVESCRGEQHGLDWYRTWVTGVGDHACYVGRLGEARRASLLEGVTPAPSARTDGSAEPPTKQERLIVLGARAVADQVREHGYDTLLAGIGSSHMVAWLAAERLRREGTHVTVAAELGMCDFTPAVGDVYLFSLRHASRSGALSGIPEILGGMVGANPRALGVLAAAEIDQHGTVNTSRGQDGTWLTGSGGANDIASTTDCVVVAMASPRRYVTEVAYRTSPGHRVREVVSQFGRFRRTAPDAGFELSSWLAENTDEPGTPERALSAVAQRTSWPAPSGPVAVEEPITTPELDLIRLLDPDGRYR